MKYSIHLNVYDGPLDLLCDLISKQKIEIKDISIFEITSQYLSYIDMLNEMDLEVTSEFITMASKLVEIKSKYLLYRQHHEEHEEDPRLELVEKLEEYKKFKKASLSLKENVNYTFDTYFRAKEEVIDDNKIDLDAISIDAIRKILPIILKTKVIEGNNKNEDLDIIVRKRVVSVEEKIDFFRNLIKKEDKLSFVKLVEYYEKDEVIATFLAILELIKEKLIVVMQNEFFDDILIIKRGVENE